MNVAALFDGMSCGQIAYDKLGIKFDGVKNKYFASEIEKNAIKVTQHNYPNTIQLGDVTKWREWDLPKIDFLIGGSPCQGFSFAGKQLNFKDERSKLFFEFVDILKAIKPKYFMLENVRMKKEYKDIISGYLGVEPININSSLVSAQKRNRYYWTNITGIEQPKDRRQFLYSVLEKEFSTKEILSDLIQSRFVITHENLPSNYCIGTTKPSFRKIGQRDLVFGDNQKMGCLVATDYKQPKQVYFDGRLRKVSPLECERLQTVPDNYTNVKGISNTKKYEMLGNGWTVDVIAHILKNAVQEYL